MPDLQLLIRRERESLITLLTGLPPDEWMAPSLCGAWTVQDVAAHLASAPSMSPLTMAVGLARSGFRVNRFNAESAKAFARKGKAAILDQLRENATTDAQPPGVPTIAALADATVHALDIRRPLARTEPVPADVFVPVAELALGTRPPLTMLIGGSARERVDGVRLVADDVDWSHGEGPEARGDAATLLLLLYGRHVGRGDLSGPGAATLYGRLA